MACSTRLEMPEKTLRNEPKVIKANLIVGSSFLIADNSNIQETASQSKEHDNDVK